ncbi:hypothetical protein Bcav_0167 [Beutenbergia cavernae DSM 12333]|uniref:Uncharacterized protein n=1 Tax=Beutenbergia cavernae (strain ATCC BAA-8 / DSM 12333 / CCUG 43141 / JCM 11478 / NBRC 16432 / NCIMB 13614 / HKI 0122) TaxID=471853 RepID=C5BVJ2_BEUC1|nr:hypothetical protein [Beutenbergia cavernae]ACQ78432.1 hypothetical protein Bcav_0167 [Beutenbergia cavernae DSM 12333]
MTVPGDLVVPAGESCTLDGTTVEGRVVVQTGADLIVSDGVFNGAVVVAADGYFDATGTLIAGNVSNRAGYGLYLESSTVGGNYIGAADAPDTFLIAYDAQFDRRVEASAGEVTLESSWVAGAVTGTGTEYLDVLDSTLLADLTVTESIDGAVLCGSEVDGDVTYTGNGGVQVGPGELFWTCEDSAYVGGNLTISGTSVGVTLNDTIVRGDLGGEGNDPAPTGAGNRVRGEVSGQFVDLEPASDAQLRSLLAEVGDRTSADATLADAMERRDSATAAATAAGDAGL